MKLQSFPLFLLLVCDVEQNVLAINIRGTTKHVSEKFKKFWNTFIEPIVPSMIQLNVKGPTTLASCDSVTVGAFNAQCWFDRFNWITSQGGIADLATLSTRVASAASNLNQSLAILESIDQPQINSELPNSIALSVGDLDSATSPALSTVNANVQAALNSANALSTSLGLTFNTTIANLWGLVSSVLSQSGQIDVNNINALITSANYQNRLSSALNSVANLSQLVSVTVPNALSTDSAGFAQRINSLDFISDSIPAIISTANANVTSNISTIQTLNNNDILGISLALTNTTTTTYRNALNTMPARINTTNNSIASTISSWSNTTNGTIAQAWIRSQSQFNNITNQLKSANTSMGNYYSQITNPSATSNSSTNSSTAAKASYNALQSNASYAQTYAQNLTMSVVNPFSANATTILANLSSALSTAVSAIRNSVANTASNPSSLGSTLTQSFSQIAKIQEQITSQTMATNQASIDAYINLTQQSTALGVLYNQLSANLVATQSALKTGVSSNASSSLMNSLQNLTNTIGSIQTALNDIAVAATSTGSNANNILSQLSTGKIPQGINAYAVSSSANMSTTINQMVDSIVSVSSDAIVAAKNDIDFFATNATSNGDAATDTYNAYMSAIRTASTNTLANGQASALSTISSTASGIGSGPSDLVDAIQGYYDSLPSAIASASSSALQKVATSTGLSDLGILGAKLKSDLSGIQADYSNHTLGARNQANAWIDQVDTTVDQFVSNSLSFQQYNVSKQESNLLGDFSDIETGKFTQPANTALENSRKQFASMSSMIRSNSSLDPSVSGSDTALAGLTDRVNVQTGQLAADSVWINSFNKLWSIVSQAFKAADGSSNLMEYLKSITKLFVTAQSIDRLLAAAQSNLTTVIDSSFTIQNKTIGSIAGKVASMARDSFSRALGQPSMDSLNGNFSAFKNQLEKILALNPPGTFVSNISSGLPSAAQNYADASTSTANAFSDSYQTAARTINETLEALAKKFSDIAQNASSLTTNPALENLKNILSGVADSMDTTSSSALTAFTESASQAQAQMESASNDSKIQGLKISHESLTVGTHVDAALAAANALISNLTEISVANQQARSNSISTAVNRVQESKAIFTNALETAISQTLQNRLAAETTAANSEVLKTMLINQIAAFGSFMSSYQDQLSEQVANNNQSLSLAAVDLQRRLSTLSQTISQSDVQISNVVDSIAQEVDSLDDSSNQVKNLSQEVEGVLNDPGTDTTVDMTPISNLVLTGDELGNIESDAASTISSSIGEVNNLIAQVTR